MAVITHIETQKHDPERVNVYLDDTFSLGISTMLVLTHGLVEGAEISEADLEELRQADEAERAHAAALNFLSFRPRSKREIADYLRKKQISEEASTTVIERLERAGLINDQEFARFWVENRQTFRPRGSRALRVEMWQKGLARDVIDEALEGLPDEEETAYEAGRKKVQSYARLDEHDFRRKMIAFLMRRGFPYEDAAAATKRLWLDVGSNQG
jgi:regulatory protein